MKTRSIFACLILLINTAVWAENFPHNFVFARKDTNVLTMDIYSTIKSTGKNPCIIFVFGGGFFEGSKSEKVNAAYCKALSDSGFVVSAMDYRLGMKGNKSKGIQAYRALKRSIKMAEEDLISATHFIVENADLLNIDPQKIFICGSSAGAVTVLQTDYDLSNGDIRQSELTTDFRYAGVISFAGGVLSEKGTPVYKKNPAPVLFFHGKEDKIVNYNKNQIFRIGFFGSNTLAEIFRKNGFRYRIYRFNNIGHEISFLPMIYYKTEIVDFMKNVMKNDIEIRSEEITIDNPDLPRAEWGSMSIKDFYKNKSDE